MNTVSQAFDSRSMPLSEPSTAPSAAAASLWRWLGERISSTLSARQQANALRDHAQELMSMDPRFAADLRAAADLHEQRHDR